MTTTKTTPKCYVTGKDYPQQYFFGTENHVVLDLSQEVFAHFIIRAGKDTVHMEIMRDLKASYDKIEAFKKEHPTKPQEREAYIDAAIALNKVYNLLTQKCESGIRILRQMKRDFEKNGKLTS
jgi:hypothetical protein